MQIIFPAVGKPTGGISPPLVVASALAVELSRTAAGVAHAALLQKRVRRHVDLGAVRVSFWRKVRVQSSRRTPIAAVIAGRTGPADPFYLLCCRLFPEALREVIGGRDFVIIVTRSAGLFGRAGLGRSLLRIDYRAVFTV
jgi:hypothetical protein